MMTRNPLGSVVSVYLVGAGRAAAMATVARAASAAATPRRRWARVMERPRWVKDPLRSNVGHAWSRDGLRGALINLNASSHIVTLMGSHVGDWPPAPKGRMFH